jgi:hypothetical protein
MGGHLADRLAGRKGAVMKAAIKRAVAWDKLGADQRRALKRVGRIVEDIALVAGGLAGARLDRLARIAGTKDFGGWGSTGLYDRWFRPRRWRKFNLLEIGVGGYDDEDGGRSLRLWRAFFPRATIVAIDLYDKTRLSRGRIQVYQCSQIDAEKLSSLASRYGGFDIVIDDGSHINAHQIATFAMLWPHLKFGGIYVIEDTQTSYWESFGGGMPGTPAHAASLVSHIKGLVDGLSHAEFLDPAYVPSALDREIVSIQFAHNLIFIEKGDNAKPSNIIGRFDPARLATAAGTDAAGKIVG